MTKTTLTRDDFENKTDVRWCPGCGDHAILTALQRLLPELGLPPEKHVFVSGIGCAGRLPYYMNTYGFHTIHGRAPAVATGLKYMRDDLTVWLITGDGDALSIGGNHLIHCLRRDVNINILLFNNQVYGLTKGQFSPTSQKGMITKTSPEGTFHEPIDPIFLALAAGASFVARGIDKDPANLAVILKKAYEHKGCSFVEIYQDCNIFNHGAFDAFALKTNRTDKTLMLEEGKPLVFGAGKEWVLVPQEDKFCVVPYKQDLGVYYKHDPQNKMTAIKLAMARFPEIPVPLGVYYQQKKAHIAYQPSISKSRSDVERLFRAKASWKI